MASNKRQQPILNTPQAPKKSKKQQKPDIFLPNFAPDFNGYQCHFLKRENYQILKFFSSGVCITKNESLAIFRIPEVLRRQLIAKVNGVLSTMEEQTQCHNPFNASEDTPVFIRLSPSTQFFAQSTTGEVKPAHRSDMLTGKCYHARVAVTLKGVKLDIKGKMLSPMLVTNQVLIIERQQQQDTSSCILDEPLCDEDRQPNTSSATTDDEGYADLFKDVSEAELNKMFEY